MRALPERLSNWALELESQKDARPVGTLHRDLQFATRGFDVLAEGISCF
jgi:hypothetical protein